MTRIQLKKGLRLLLQGREYTIEQRLPTGEIQLRNLLTNTCSNLKEIVLTQLLFQGELQFLSEDSSRVKQQNHKRYSSTDFTELPPALREEAKRRYSYVSRVLSSTPNKRTATTLEPIISLVSREIEDRQPPSWLTVYRWLKNYSSSGEDIRLPLFVVDTETRLPLGTPWLTSAIDKYSGVNLGYYASFEPPSYLSVMQCLSHAIRTKNYLHSQYPNVENDW
ncbi:MAG: hypothetical protein WBM86_14590, partial [Waterburya sp.]